MIQDKCEFTDNIAINETGDAIYCSSSLKNVTISSSKFLSSRDSNFFDFQAIQKVLIEKSKLQCTSKPAKITKSSGFTVSDIQNFTVKLTEFINLAGNSDQGGGAIRIVDSTKPK